MKISNLIRTFLCLIGIHTVFSAILTSSMAVLVFPFTIFMHGFSSGLESTAFSILSILFQFFIPIVVGTVFVTKSSDISGYIVRKAGLASDEKIEMPLKEDFSYMCFSLLGLYMLSLTLPAFCRFAAYSFQLKVQESALFYSGDGTFLQENLQELVYHFVAVGFALLVFMKGKNFALLTQQIRKPTNKTVVRNDE